MGSEGGLNNYYVEGYTRINQTRTMPIQIHSSDKGVIMMIDWRTG